MAVMPKVDISSPPNALWARPGVTLYGGNACDVLPFLAATGMITNPPWVAPEYFKTQGNRVNHEADVAWYGQQWVFYASWLTLAKQAGVQWGWIFLHPAYAPAFLRVSQLIGYTVQHLWTLPDEWLVYLGAKPLTSSTTGAVDVLYRRFQPGRWKAYTDLALLLGHTPAVRAGTIVDPFCGYGSTLLAATLLNLCAIGIEAKPERAEGAIAALETLEQ